jgi:putative pyruvate formate lyase activating enzyme
MADFSLLDLYPANLGGHVAFIEYVRGQLHHAAEAKRQQFARNYPDTTVDSTIRAVQWKEARKRVVALPDLSGDAVAQVASVLRRELTAGTVVQLDELIERPVRALRLAGQRGPCKADATARVFRHRIEYSEELELIPSHLFYLSGCDLRCVFCIAEANAFDPRRGERLTKDFLATAVHWGRGRGARNIQWVGGEPTIHIPAILDAMAGCTDLPPVVWKSDFHGTPEAFSLLDGAVSVYVADFKFGNDQCARRMAGIDNYLQIVTRNLQIAAGQADLIVRHLLLPGHFDCCYRPIVAWMRHNLPCAKFSIRDGFLPKWQSQHFPELAEPLDRQVGRQARDLAGNATLNLIN